MDVGLKTDLEDFLVSFRGQRILFVPNPGNAGDSVIACAEYQLFDRLGINYRVISAEVSPSETQGEIVFYGGGGNLVALYHDARDFIARHHKEVKQLVVLPHTIVAYPELLASLGNNVDLMCREQLSHDYVASSVSAARVHLMDDAAFSLDVKRLLARASIAENAWFNRPLMAAKHFTRVLRHRLRNVRQRHTLNAFRGDAENTGRWRTKANFDVPQMFYPESMSALDSVLTARCMVRFINRFDVVKTDRLHVCIVSLLLGKEVHFYDNSYGKNRAVYERSMLGRYPSLKWCG
jgi:exopolysaccharide biosynthesis predicted pyruvyltransferase EpsI